MDGIEAHVDTTSFAIAQPMAGARGIVNRHLVPGRGVQYVHWVMHKCIMVKVGGKYT